MAASRNELVDEDVGRLGRHFALQPPEAAEEQGIVAPEGGREGRTGGALPSTDVTSRQAGTPVATGRIQRQPVEPWTSSRRHRGRRRSGSRRGARRRRRRCERCAPSRSWLDPRPGCSRSRLNRVPPGCVSAATRTLTASRHAPRGLASLVLVASAAATCRAGTVGIAPAMGDEVAKGVAHLAGRAEDAVDQDAAAAGRGLLETDGERRRRGRATGSTRTTAGPQS